MSSGDAQHVSHCAWAGTDSLNCDYHDLEWGVPTLGDLRHRITLELIAEIGLPHHRLLSSNLGSKASRKLGAIQADCRMFRTGV